MAKRGGRIAALAKEERRTRTEKITYFVKYRNPTGNRQLSKFRAGKKLVPEVWLRIARVPRGQTKAKIFYKRVDIRPTRRAKNPITGRNLKKFVKKLLVKKRVTGRVIEELDAEGQVVVTYKQAEADK